MSPKQEAAGEKLAPKTQKAAPRERHTSPEPVKTTTWESWQRELIPWKSRTEEASVEDPVAPDQKLSRAPDTKRKPTKNSKDKSRKARAKERRKDYPEDFLRHRAAEVDVWGQSQWGKDRARHWRTE